MKNKLINYAKRSEGGFVRPLCVSCRWEGDLIVCSGPNTETTMRRSFEQHQCLTPRDNTKNSKITTYEVINRHKMNQRLEGILVRREDVDSKVIIGLPGELIAGLSSDNAWKLEDAVRKAVSLIRGWSNEE